MIHDHFPHFLAEMKMVRVAGVEPALLAEPDFESGASTNSTTPALSRLAPM